MSNGDCIEAASLNNTHVGVRDSKTVSGPVLRFPNDAWMAFVCKIQQA
jgi:hypothetical protein